MLLLPVSIGDLITMGDKALQWFNRIKGKKEQKAAKIMMSAGFLVATLRVLDNSIQKIFSNIKLDIQNLTRDKREELVREVNYFAQKEELISKIRIYQGELEAFDIPKEARISEATETIKRATKVITGVLVAGSSPFPNKKSLDDFLASLRQIEDPSEQARLEQLCTDILSAYDRNIIGEAEKSLGKLRGVILDKYPNLPYPDWI